MTNGERIRSMTDEELATFCCGIGWQLGDEEECQEWLSQKLPPEPQLTDAELVICHTLGAKWVSRDGCAGHTDLWANKPKQIGGDSGVWYDNGDLLGTVKSDLFLSINQGDCVKVPE